jgi:hypothetical protein
MGRINRITIQSNRIHDGDLYLNVSRLRVVMVCCAKLSRSRLLVHYVVGEALQQHMSQKPV